MNYQYENTSFWNEKWKKIYFKNINESEHYDISDYGRIRRYYPDKKEFKILKSSYIKGYKVFAFKSGTPEKKTITKTIHKLVASAFCEKPSKEHRFVIHLDFIKDNNHCQNLKWVTHQEMYAHHKNNPNYKKGIIRNSKLNETDVIRLKKKLGRSTNKLYKIAREFGITHTQLNRIRSGENWGHIKVEED
jgi:hypothetical protein